MIFKNNCPGYIHVCHTIVIDLLLCSEEGSIIPTSFLKTVIWSCLKEVQAIPWLQYHLHLEPSFLQFKSIFNLTYDRWENKPSFFSFQQKNVSETLASRSFLLYIKQILLFFSSSTFSRSLLFTIFWTSPVCSCLKE